MKTPIRHGDWHLIDGQLVDMSQQPESPRAPAPSPPTPLPEGEGNNTGHHRAVTGSDVDGEPLPPSLPPSSSAPGKRRSKPTED